MISIIGSGRVGSAVAFLIASAGLDDVLLVNRTKNKAIGESLDIANAIPAKAKISIEGTDDISKIKNSKIIVITASLGKIKEERTDLLKFNLSMIQEISNSIRKFADDAKIIIVTNPVDIITHLVLKETEFSANNVIGMGSGLDSTRFRYLLSKELGVQPNLIEGIVIGEHGITMIPVFSNAKFSGKDLKLNQKQRSTITHELRNYWRYLVEYKGASVFGAAKNTFDMITSIHFDKALKVPAQVYLDGQYGLTNLCIGVPIILRNDGIERIVEINLNKSESDLLHQSALKIKHLLDEIKIKKSY